MTRALAWTWVALAAAGCGLGDDYPDYCEDELVWSGGVLDQPAIGALGERDLVLWHRRSELGSAAVNGATAGDGTRAYIDTRGPGENPTAIAGPAATAVTWTSLEAAGTRIEVLSPSGAAVADPIDIAGTAAVRGAWVDDALWVVWASSDQIRLTRVDASGAELEPAIVVAEESATHVRVARLGSDVWIVWTTPGGTVRGALLGADGEERTSPGPLGMSALLIEAAGDGDRVLVAGSGPGTPPTTILLDRDGPVSVPASLDVPTTPRSLAGLTVAGDGYLLALDAGNREFPCSECEVVAYRLDADGALADPAPLARMPGLAGSVYVAGDELRAAVVTGASNGDTEGSTGSAEVVWSRWSLAGDPLEAISLVRTERTATVREYCTH